MRGTWATMRASMAEAASNRASLGSQMTVMIVNDAVWIVFWTLFFRRVGDVRGWNIGQILILQAVLTAAGGISLGLLANARRIGSLAVEGGLDAVLALPVPPLAHVLARRVEPTNLGDLAFGVTLFVVVGHPTPQRVVVFVGVVIASAVLVTSFLVLAGSTAFFAGRNEGGELGFHAIVLLGSYPVDVFAGVAKVFLYTVVPAAFISTVPTRLVDSFDTGQALALFGISATFAVAGWATFTLGLRRYTSGAVWTRA